MSTTVRANVDAYVDQDFPAKNFGSEGSLRLNGGVGTNDQQAFIFFARPFPLGAQVLAATLRVYLRGSWAGVRTLTFSRVVDKWGENGIVWNNKPGINALHAVAVVVTDGADGDELEVDLSDQLQDVANGGAFFGVRVVSSTNDDHRLYSSDAPTGGLHPTLELEWSMPPEASTNLRPTGDQAVGIAAPVLTWQYVDKQKDSRQGSSQVQVSTVPDFETTVYDSGKVANVDGAWDLSEDGFSMDPGDELYWRVKVWNEHDLAGPWSDGAKFTRVDHGTLTLDNPPAGPGSFVDETTPPIAWTFTDATQKAARVILWHVFENGGTDELWRFPKTVTDATSVHVPKGLLKSGKDYRVQVDVWDDIDRHASAGDLNRETVRRTFTYERDGTPDPPLTLTGDVDVTRAAVVLEWTCATMPDYFSVRVDGVEVIDRLDPLDVFVAGTTYRFTWWRADSGTPHEYEIERVVNDAGKLHHSHGNPAVTVATLAQGIWLVDDTPGDQLAVQIADKQQVDLSIGQDGETFNTVGGRPPVRIVSAERGYEGSVGGVIIADRRRELTGREQRDNFEELQGRNLNGRAIRVIVKDLNFPADLGQCSDPPRPDPGDRYNASAEVFQSGEFNPLLAAP